MGLLKVTERINHQTKIDVPSENVSTYDNPILLAEDNLDDILIIKRVWKKGKIKNRLFIVRDGEEAIDFLYKKKTYKNAPKPSLMLLDLKMPKMDGFEVLQKVREDDSLKNMPIIVLTTSNREKDVNRAYKLGCNSYIIKPVNFDNFIKAIMQIQNYWLYLCELPTT